VIRLTNPDYLPPTAGDGQCLAVWEVPSGDHPAFLAWVASVLGARVDGEPARTVSARYHHARERTLRVDYVFLPAGRGDCR
jgi:hypothetical protein